MLSFFKLLYFVCCISSLFFTQHSFAWSQCDQSFSSDENGKMIKPGMVGETLVRNAEIKLEQDLEMINLF